jgi:uncharacterized protein involved in exopolysaccharide biosynthesis
MQLVKATNNSLLPTRRDIAARLFRKRKVFIVCFLLVVLGFLLSGQFRPKYRSEMKILVRKERVDPVLTTASTSTPELQTMSVREEDLNSEVELLRGEDILRQVVLQAGLVPAGETNQVVIAKALIKLQHHLDVSAVTKTDLISVAYESPNPTQSRHVLEVLASLYLNKRRNIQGRDDQVAFFEQQVRDHGALLNAAEAKLLDFTRKTGVVSADLERDLTVKQAKDLSQQQMETSAEIAELQERDKQLAVQMLGESDRISTETKVGDNPQLLQQLKTTLLGLQLKRTELINKYDSHYRLVQDVDREIATAQAMVDAQTAAPVRESTSDVNPTRLLLDQELTKSRAQLTGLRAKQSQLSESAANLARSADDLTEKDVEQDALLRNVKTEKDQYQLYVDKLEQARMTHSLDSGGIFNVVIAQQPMIPALPANAPLSVLAAMLFSGTLLSLGAAFVSDVSDPTVRTPAELGETMPFPILAEFGREIYLERGGL